MHRLQYTFNRSLTLQHGACVSGEHLDLAYRFKENYSILAMVLL